MYMYLQRRMAVTMWLEDANGVLYIYIYISIKYCKCIMTSVNETVLATLFIMHLQYLIDLCRTPWRNILA